MGGETKKNHEKKENQEKVASAKKRKRKEVAIFGNYRNYYGYRISEGMEEDPRLKVMKNEWFEGKDCLDIGCNCGLITISIAKKFNCQSILGIDIDGARIEDAHWHLRKILKMSSRKVPSKADRPADSEELNSSENHVTETQGELMNENSGDAYPSEGKDLSNIVSFEKGNFIHSWHPPKDTSYHAILCLSVSKWIHLNWGDDGLITLFSKAWRLLKPGGVFILEPQPWISYSKNRLVSEIAAFNYRNIKIHPEDFQDILLDKIGFRKVENITSSLCGTKVGFDRPILALWK